MNEQMMIQDTSLVIAFSLVIISLVFSRTQKLRLEKETLISVIRAILQLIVIGYILDSIFGLQSKFFTTLLLISMILNAAYNAKKRGKDISNIYWISALAIFVGAFTTLSILVFSGAIEYQPYQIIPISGMIISNATVAMGLCYKQLAGEFKNKRQEIETKLSLGGDILESSRDIIRGSIRTGMIPTIDAAKLLGIVSLPGMMTGLILAGVSPMVAIKYQIMVTFMLLSTTAISSFIASFLAYKRFFNERKQLQL
jgi:putative ABC transport system permease protein